MTIERKEEEVFVSLSSREIYDAIDRVKKGIRLLDDQVGGAWGADIDPSALDICSDFNCILGQLFGSYGDGLARLEMASAEGYEYGFDVTLRDAHLTEGLWCSYLTGVPLTVNDIEVEW